MTDDTQQLAAAAEAAEAALKHLRSINAGFTFLVVLPYMCEYLRNAEVPEAFAGLHDALQQGNIEEAEQFVRSIQMSLHFLWPSKPSPPQEGDDLPWIRIST